MKITINDREHDVPFFLKYITMGQWISYYKQFGKQLQGQYKAVETKDYANLGSADQIEVLKTADLHEVEEAEALGWFSFWTGFDLTSIENEDWKAQLATRFRVMREGLTDVSELILDLTAPIEFAGELWSVQNHDLNESIEGRQLTRQIVLHLHHLKKGRWNALPFLCAVYFRKVGEPFDKAFIDPDGERHQLLESLPMHIGQSIALMLMDVREPEGAGEFVQTLEN